MSDEKKEEIRKIIAEHIEEIGNKFDDFLCYEKYGEEKFLAPGFRPTEEDYERRKLYVADEFSNAAQKIKQMGEEAISILKELSQTESNPDIKDWASRILHDMK